MFTCILLSAGLSERFGSPKALANISGSTAISLVQNALLKSTCDKIIVVLGAHREQIEPSIFIHSRIRVVYNKHYNFGQTSSVQAGLREADLSSQGIMFWPVDCPFIKSETIDHLIEHFKNKETDILIPTYQNKKGHPPLFHPRLNKKILGLEMTQGLNSLFTEHPPETVEINDPGITKSFNSIQELKRIISKQ